MKMLMRNEISDYIKNSLVRKFHLCVRIRIFVKEKTPLNNRSIYKLAICFVVKPD